MKKLLAILSIVALLILFLDGCSTLIEKGDNQISAIQTADIKTEIPEYIQNDKGEKNESDISLSEEPIPTQSPEPTNSNSVVIIPAPSSTPQQKDDFSGSEILGAHESGGVLIEVRGISFGIKSEFISEGLDFLTQEEFDSSDIIGEISFVIANKIEERVKIYPSSVIVVINGEQLDLSEWWNEIFSTPCGHIYPGVTRAGRIWFNIDALELQDINEMEIFIKTPYQGGDQTPGEDYYFELDISNHVIEE